MVRPRRVLRDCGSASGGVDGVLDPVWDGSAGGEVGVETDG